MTNGVDPVSYTHLINKGDTIDLKYSLHMALEAGNELQSITADMPIYINLKPVSYTHLDVYKRQGDNNPTPDTDLVKPQDIKGTVINKVPKIGWLTLLVKGDKEIPIDL